MLILKDCEFLDEVDDCFSCVHFDFCSQFYRHEYLKDIFDRLEALEISMKYLRAEDHDI